MWNIVSAISWSLDCLAIWMCQWKPAVEWAHWWSRELTGPRCIVRRDTGHCSIGWWKEGKLPEAIYDDHVVTGTKRLRVPKTGAPGLQPVTIGRQISLKTDLSMFYEAWAWISTQIYKYTSISKAILGQFSLLTKRNLVNGMATPPRACPSLFSHTPLAFQIFKESHPVLARTSVICHIFTLPWCGCFRGWGYWISDSWENGMDHGTWIKREICETKEWDRLEDQRNEEEISSGSSTKRRSQRESGN